MSAERCKGCGERIVFVVTLARGRPMPVNPEVVKINLLSDRLATDADREASWRRVAIVTADGTLYRGYQIPVPGRGSIKIAGRISHYSTCPKAGYYRSRAARKRAGPP